MKHFLNTLLLRWICTFSLITGSVCLSLAQELKTISIKGTVTSVEDNSPLIGATVVQKGTNNGTSTDESGVFSLSVPPNATIIISYTGYQTKEVEVDGRSNLNVSLEQSFKQLKDVVVVAYGTQRKRDVTGAISTVDGNELKDMPVSNVGQRLQGKIAGAQIYMTNGEPGGGGLAFRIRGQASINAGNSPLVVIDGFPSLTGLSAISPSTIESITVLKDASASSLYGSRAANGVILVTTKQAKEGQKHTEFSAYYGIEVVPQRGRPDLMNAREFAQFKKEYYEDAAIYEGYTGGVPERYKHPEQYNENSGTDWYNVLLRNALTQDYNLSLSNGISDLKTAVNLNYNNQEGVILNTYSKRFNGRINTIFKASDILTFGLNLGVTYRKSQITPSLGGGRNIIASAFLMDPTIEYKNSDGTYPIAFTSPGMFPNPNYYLVVTQRVNPQKQINALANFYTEIKLYEGLKYKFSGNMDLENSVDRMFEPSTVSGAMFSAPPQPAIGSYNTGRNMSWLVENTLTYSKTINENHNFDVLLGFSSQEATFENSNIDATQYPDDEIGWINAAVTRIGDAGTSKWSIESFIGRLNYNFKQKYLISAAFRRDGSSRFGSAAKWANFPSISVGWVPSEEKFMKNVNKVSWLKIRASYGKVGNYNIGNYSHLATVSSANYVLGNQVVGGKALTGMGNSNLTWESTDELDIGLDLGLFKGRIFFTYDYYKKKTKGLLYQIDIPAQSGFNSITSNIGEFHFWGHEFTVESKNLIGEFKWNTNFNISFNRNLAVKLGTNNTPIGGYPTAGSDINRTQVGHPLGQFYGWIYEGVYMTEEEFETEPHHARSMVGTAKYKDVSGPNGVPDGIIDDFDKTVIGDPNPDFIYGITNQFSYKNFDLSIVLAGSVGGDIFQWTREWTENLDGVFNVRKEAAQRWRSLKDPGRGNIARTRSGTTSLSRWHISRFIFDGSYLAAKNITLGYTIPFHGFKYINNARVYLTAQNAFILTNYPGMNPEVSGNKLNGLSMGVDMSSYPVSETFAFGLDISF